MILAPVVHFLQVVFFQTIIKHDDVHIFELMFAKPIITVNVEASGYALQYSDMFFKPWILFNNVFYYYYNSVNIYWKHCKLSVYEVWRPQRWVGAGIPMWLYVE